MRGFGTILFLLVIMVCGLSVSGLALGKLGATDKMVAEFVQQEGWGAGTRWSVQQQGYFFGILQVQRNLAAGSNGDASANLLLVGGVPVKMYQPRGFGLVGMRPQEGR